MSEEEVQKKKLCSTITLNFYKFTEGYNRELGTVVHACNLSTWKAEKGGPGVPASLEHTVRPTLRKLATTSVVGTMSHFTEDL